MWRIADEKIGDEKKVIKFLEQELQTCFSNEDRMARELDRCCYEKPTWP